MPSSEDRYDAFAEHYLAAGSETYLNILQSGLKAGFKYNYMKAKGVEVLETKGMKKALAKKRREIAKVARDKKKIATPEEVLQGHTRDIRFNPKWLFDKDGNPKDPHKLPNRAALSLRGLEITEDVILGGKEEGDTQILKRKYKYKFPDKRASLDSLAKCYGMMNGKGKDSLDDFMKEFFTRIFGGNVQMNIGNDVIQMALRQLADGVDGMTRGIPETHHLNKPKNDEDWP